MERPERRQISASEKTGVHPQSCCALGGHGNERRFGFTLPRVAQTVRSPGLLHLPVLHCYHVLKRKQRGWEHTSFRKLFASPMRTGVRTPAPTEKLRHGARHRGTLL